MIPILYPENETSFTTQGLGRLSGVLDCIVTEERNGQYELELEYPVDGIHWGDIAHSRIIYAKPADGKDPQPFRIYRISKPLNGRCMIYARHISYQLSHIPVMPFSARSFTAALSGLVNNAAETCPFTVWTDKTTTGEFEVSVPTSFRSLLGGQEGSLLDAFGTAEYEFDKYVVKAHVNRGVDRGVVLRYGKNITDLKQEENIANTITGICPYWVDRGTGDCKTLPEKVLWSNRASNFPYKRTVPVDFSDDFEEEPTDAQLREAGNNYISTNNIGVPDVTINMAFISLWQSAEYANTANLERVNLCDIVTVVFEKLGISAQAKVVKTVFDVLRERYRSIDIGNTRSTLAKTIVAQNEITNQKIKDSKSMLEAYINYVSEKITGGKGGYIVFNYNADGLPEEMLIMDTQSEDTATNIMRFNKNGIAFSTNGGATYNTGWTIDGVFSANFIGTGVLDANLIRAGVLQDVAGTNYWDMETGEFRLASNTKVGDSGTTDTISSLLSDLQTSLETQIDEKIETYYQSSDPFAGKAVSTLAAQDGDLWYYTGNTTSTLTKNATYRYDYSAETGSTHVTSAWKECKVSQDVFDEIDGKTTIFYGTTSKTYSGVQTGDYLVDSTDGCTYRWSGSVWVKATDYSSAISTAISSLQSTLETQIDAKVETWAQSTNPASSWTTNAIRQKHDGDLWLYTGTSSITVGGVTIKPQGVYQYSYNSGSPVWTAYSSTSNNLFDLADGKSTIYYGTYRTGSASNYTPNSTAKALAVGDFRYYSGYTYICTDASTPTWTRFTTAETGDYLVDSYTGCTYKWTGSAWSKQTDYATAIDNAVDDYDDTLTQQKIFNRLTNNGQTQGIYLSDGKLYINATYIATGTLADAGNNTTFNLSTGALTMKKGSINIGSGTFQVTTSGALTATSATIRGTFICGPNPSKSSSGGYWTELDSAGRIKGGYGSTQYGYIDYSADSYDIDDPSITYKGIQIQAGSASQRGILRIATNKISVYAGYNTSQTATYGATGTMRVVFKSDSSGTWWYDYDFINGLLVSIPHTS